MQELIENLNNILPNLNDTQKIALVQIILDSMETSSSILGSLGRALKELELELATIGTT